MIRLLSITMLVCAPVLFAAETVTAVEDGDTLTLSASGVVRLFGIDAPELTQPGGAAARAFVQEQTKGKAVTATVRATDAAGAPVVVLALGDDAVLNEALLSAGHAWWDRKNAPDATKYKGLNAKAIVGKKGLYAEGAPLAPWDYRLGEGIEEPAYAVEPASSEPVVADAPEADTPKELKLKGNYAAEAAAAGLPLGGDFGEVDVGSLMTKHQPEIARDAQGNALGLTAQNISQIPYAAAIGLRDGDIVSEVNGVRIDSEASVLSLVGQLQGQKNIQATVIRNGKPEVLNIRIP